MREHWAGFGKIILVVILAFLLNFVWENLHSRLYFDDQVEWKSCPPCYYATSVDIFYTLVLYSVYLLSRRRSFMPVAAGAAIAIIIEVLALRDGRWSYRATMPLIPFLNIGLSPVVQMALLPILNFKITEKISLKLWPIKK